jgi:hypothetical protein
MHRMPRLEYASAIYHLVAREDGRPKFVVRDCLLLDAKPHSLDPLSRCSPTPAQPKRKELCPRSFGLFDMRANGLGRPPVTATEKTRRGFLGKFERSVHHR